MPAEAQHPKLQEWINEQVIGDEMLWKSSWGHQMMVLRDVIRPLFCVGMEDEDDRDATARVISTHRSKSLLLPVVKYTRPFRDGELVWVLRNNFHNWKLSVISPVPIEGLERHILFDGLFHTTPPIDPDYTGNELSPVYFEGFPREYIFNYYNCPGFDHMKWSAEIFDSYQLYTALFLMQRALGLAKPWVWHTKESHRQELDAMTARRKEREAKKAVQSS